MNMFKNFFLLLSILFFCGCATIYNPATGREEIIFINDATEVAIGKSVAAEIIKKQKILNDARLQVRVERVGKRLASVSDRTNIGYEFHILDNKELNAISLPGGIIYINKGLLDKINDEELAFIFGHEIGHIAAKHAVKSIQSSMAFQLILSVAFAAAGEKGLNTATDIAKTTSRIYNIIALGYSRQDEYLADKLGVKYAFKAGFNPYAALSALEKLKEGRGFNLKILEFFRTHPYVDERINALKNIIPQLSINKKD